MGGVTYSATTQTGWVQNKVVGQGHTFRYPSVSIRMFSGFRSLSAGGREDDQVYRAAAPM